MVKFSSQTPLHFSKLQSKLKLVKSLFGDYEAIIPLILFVEGRTKYSLLPGAGSADKPVFSARDLFLIGRLISALFPSSGLELQCNGCERRHWICKLEYWAQLLQLQLQKI
jgi:hypothetical protein